VIARTPSDSVVGARVCVPPVAMVEGSILVQVVVECAVLANECTEQALYNWLNTSAAGEEQSAMTFDTQFMQGLSRAVGRADGVVCSCVAMCDQRADHA
jgi:uncharacterized protein (UPF0210 family)